MAVIQYTGLIDQIRGSIAGTTFTKGKDGFIVMRKGAPRKNRSISQSSVNVGFAVNAGNWNSLTPSQQTDWNTLASLVQVYNRLGILSNISGYNFYILASQIKDPKGLAGPLIADGTDKPPYQIDLQTDTLDFQSNGGEMLFLDFTGTITISSSVPEACTVAIYISQPSTAILPVFGTDWYRIGSISIAGGLLVSATQSFSFLDIPVPYGLRVLDNANYLVSAIVINEISQNFSPRALADSFTANLEPPIGFPDFSFISTPGVSYFEAGSGFTTFISVSLSNTGGDEPASSYNWEWYYRGYSIPDVPFFATDNIYLATTLVSSPFPNIGFTHTETNTSTDPVLIALNSAPFPKSYPGGADYLMLTVIPVFVGTGLRGKPINFVLARNII